MFRTLLVTLASAVLVAGPAVAQETPQTFIGAAYYRCTIGSESQADAFVRDVVGPIIQKHVDAGHLTGWGWMSHAAGGAWRRLMAMVGTDLGQLMDMRAAVLAEVAETAPEAIAEFNAICGSHDDYLWRSVAVSGTNPDVVGDAAMSAYYACNQSTETRSDEIFTEVLAPLFAKHQDMGHLASWGYYAHRFGGIFRRLMTYSGSDHKTLMQMQEAIMEEANANAPEAMSEFRSVCNWHSDYMWNNSTQP